MRESPADVAEQLKMLTRSKVADLKRLWTAQFGNPPRFRAQRNLLVLILAYRLQEKAYGGLSQVTRKRLRALEGAIGNGGMKHSRAAPPVKPGTRLIREWRGQTHVVSVLDKGAEYRGKRYGSLSEIARAITGTRWSGPAFFGLKSPSASGPEGQREPRA